MPTHTMRALTAYILIGAALCAGVGIGWGLFRAPAATLEGTTREGGYSLVNPLLTCDISEESPSPALSGMQSTLEREAQSLVSQGKASRISVYFRDMDSGTWTGVAPDEQFIPASLVKVPVLLAYYKAAERDPELFLRSVTLSKKNFDVAQDIAPVRPITPGGTYGVRTLLRAMIVDSDDNAFEALNAYIATSTEEEVLGLLGFSPGSADSESVSPKEFMYAFRLLYNATYLSRADSQAALALFAQSSFKDGLVAGVPSGMPVAHKFGEREVPEGAELNDCGIVYYPRSPYGLCVMTSGADLSSLKAVIADMSKSAYREVAGGILSR